MFAKIYLLGILYMLFSSLGLVINSCIEDSIGQLAAAFNSSVYELPGARGICVFNDTGSQRNVLVCWNKSTSSPVCGENQAQICPLISMDNEQSKLFLNTTGLLYTTLVFTYKFYQEGHFYGVDTEICRHARARPTLYSSVQVGESVTTLVSQTSSISPSKSLPAGVGESLTTLVFQPSSISPSKSLPAGAGESSLATSVSVTSPPAAGESSLATSVSVTSPPAEHKGMKIGAGIVAGCVVLGAVIWVVRRYLRLRPHQDIKLSEIHHGDK